MTYTNHWPHEPLIGNTPAPALWVWSDFSVPFLIADTPCSAGTTR